MLQSYMMFFWCFLFPVIAFCAGDSDTEREGIPFYPQCLHVRNIDDGTWILCQKNETSDFAIYDVSDCGKVLLSQKPGAPIVMSGYVEMVEKWYALLSDLGVVCCYRGTDVFRANILSGSPIDVCVSGKKHAGCTCVEKPFEGKVWNVLKVTPSFSGILQVCGDVAFYISPVIREGLIDFIVETHCEHAAKFCEYASRLAIDCPTIESANVDKIYPVLALPSLTTVDENTVVKGVKAQKMQLNCSRNVPASSCALEPQFDDAPEGMTLATIRTSQMKFWYKQKLEPTQQGLCMCIKHDEDCFYLYLQQCAKTAIFSLKYGNRFNSVLAALWCGDKSVVFEGRDLSEARSPQIGLCLKNVGSVNIWPYSQNAVWVRRHEYKSSTHQKVWNFSVMKGMYMERPDALSQFSFNFTGVPICRVMSGDLAEVACQNIASRKVHITSGVWLCSKNGILELQYRTVRSRHRPIVVDFFKEYLESPLDLRKLEVCMMRDQYASQFHWQEYRLMAERCMGEEQIRLTLHRAGQERCRAVFPTPGDLKTFLLQKSCYDPLMHIYFLFWGWNDFIHVAFDENPKPICWRGKKTSGEQTLFSISSCLSTGSLVSVPTVLKMTYQKLCWYIGSHLLHPIIFPARFDEKSRKILYPTHYSAHFVHERLEISILHDNVVLGGIYIDHVLPDHNTPFGVRILKFDSSSMRPRRIFWVFPDGTVSAS